VWKGGQVQLESDRPVCDDEQVGVCHGEGVAGEEGTACERLVHERQASIQVVETLLALLCTDQMQDCDPRGTAAPRRLQSGSGGLRVQARVRSLSG
jgi:hypothetical protein